eukprot:TRINITY_DN2207_c0_g1_i6.p4 TRINITY_DN2207_c0_g1~~TRINITY_DN2207_c0_g1_i6.p4  ORF type:complete len:162 (-),score=15.42 TRINITY_DN2207_c0_g1_i6:472-957(-)
MVYFGINTSCNKANWSFFTIFLIVALVASGFSLFYGLYCTLDKYKPCMDNLKDTGAVSEDDIKKEYFDKWIDAVTGRSGSEGSDPMDTCVEELKECARPGFPIAFIGAIVFYILAIVPLIVMCSCAPKPESEGDTKDPLLTEKKDINSFPVTINETDESKV